MVSNEVASLEPGEARPALLLTPKSRIVAPLRVVREGPESFLLITEAELAETVALDAAARALRGQVRDRAQAVPRLPAARRGRGDPQRRLRRRGLRELGRGGARGAPTPSELERAADRGRHAASGAASSTRRSSPPRPASTRRTSPSRRAATRARSRSRGCTTAAARTAACACSRSRTREPGDEIVLGEKAVGRVTSAVPGLALSATSGARSPTTRSSRSAAHAARLH